MKQIQLKDFLNYHFLSSLTASDDGSFCVFTDTTCDEETNSYNSNLYVIQDESVKALTTSGKDTNPLILDHETILFKSSRDSKTQERIKNGEELSCYYTISIHGGEAKKAFDLPLFVSKIEILNDNEFILTASYDKDYSTHGREEQKESLIKSKKENAGIEVFTKIPFCHNGSGYAKNTVQRLYRFNAKTNELTALTSVDCTVSSFQLSQDHSELLVMIQNDKSKPNRKSAVKTLNIETGAWTTWIEENEMNIHGAWYFQDGILVIGNQTLTHGQNENGRFYFIDKHKQMTLFYDNVMSTHSSVGSDCRYGGGKSHQAANGKFYYVTTRNKDSVLVSLDQNGHLQDELVINGSVDCFDVVHDQIYAICMKDGKLQEVYRNDAQLTQMNEDVLKDKYVADYQEVVFENDGISFTGWVLLPKDYDPNKKYPAIFDIHGGPKTVYGTVFYHEMQLWANMGYFVFFTNPRGSDGRDNEFMNIFGKYGTIDYDDLMVFTDKVLESYPAIDVHRVGVTGGSYGGFMTNWIIGHTNRFACAATQRSISNWISFYGTSDIGMFFAEDQIHGNVFHNPEKLWEHSPLKYAGNVTTPTLFIHSDEDYRCPLEQGLQLYTALVDQGVETRFILFHGENHELSRSGKPKQRIRRLEEITNWMEDHLK